MSEKSRTGAGRGTERAVPPPIVPAQLIYEATHDAMWVMRVEPDERFVITSINPAYTALTGLHAEQMLGKTPQELLGPEDLAHVLARHQEAVRQRRPVRYEESLVVGRQFVVETTLTPVFDASGRCTHILGASRDISERKAIEQEKASLEAQLSQSQRMETIGTFATGIAREFANLIAVVQAHIDVARKDARRSPKVLKSLAASSRACRHANQVVAQILAFGARPPTAEQATSLAQVARDALDLVRATLPAGQTVQLHEARDIPAVAIDATEIRQVIVSLALSGSRRLGSAGGAVEVHIDPVHVPDLNPGSSALTPPGLFTRLSVSTTPTAPVPDAPGVPSDAGMDLVHRVVAAHGGALTSQLQPGRGPTVSVYLPAASSDQAGAGSVTATGGAPPRPREESRRPKPRVMYIDDHKWLLPLAERLLAEHGFEIQGFVNPHAALGALHDDIGRYAAVVTDYKMPQVTGLDIARAVKAARPDLPVVLVSAYLSDELNAQALRAGVDALVYKQSLLRELVPAVTRLVPPAAENHPQA